ncbi:MAG: hypothetical protein WA766_03700 [Candidatus Acidiferrales bacterium]
MGGVGGALEELAAKALSSKAGRVAGEFGLESGAHALERQGPFSSALSSALKTYDSTWRSDSGRIVEPMLKDFEEIIKSPDKSAQYYDALAKGAVPKDATVSTAAVTHPVAMKRAYLRVKNLQTGVNLKTGTPTFAKVGPEILGPYWPRKYPHELFEGAGRERTLEYLVKSGQAKDASDAINLLNSLNRRNPFFPKYHNIETGRYFDLPGFRKDPAVVLEHLVSSTKLYHRVNMFGQNGEKLNQLMTLIKTHEGEANYQYAKSITSDFLGGNFDAIRGDLERHIESFQTVTKLGLAPISHIFQPLNAVLITGIRPMLEAIGHTIADYNEPKSFGLISGAILEPVIANTRRLARADMQTWAERSPHMRLFSAYDIYRRVLVAESGKISAMHEFAKLLRNPSDSGARIRLNTLGVDIDGALKRGGLGEDELRRAGQKLSDITQFRRNVLELPPAWNRSAAARLVTQYKPFFFQQAKFIKDQVLLPALRGQDYKPLLYMAALFPTFGEIAADLKNYVRGKSMEDRPDLEEHTFDRVVENISQIGGFGIFADTINAMTSSSPTMTYQFLTGPSVSDVVEATRLPFSNHETIERAFLRRIPTLGPATSRMLVPPKHKTKYKSLYERASKQVDEYKKLVGVE